MTAEIILTLMAGAGMGMSISGLVNATLGPEINFACAISVTTITFLCVYFGAFG